MKRYGYSTEDRIEDFDRLFTDKSRIEWPGKAPLTILLRGAEGSGKSTLALQLACLGVSEEVVGVDGTREDVPKRHRRCVLYYVVDDFPERILEKYHAYLAAFGGRSGVKPRRVVLGFDEDRIPGCSPGGVEVGFGETVSGEGDPEATHLFLFQYSGERMMSDLLGVIRKHVDEVEETRRFNECVVVVDSISGFETESRTGDTQAINVLAQQDDSDAAPARIDSVISHFPQKGDGGLPLPAAVILVDEEVSQHGRDPYLADVYISLRQGGHQDVRETGYCERYLQVVKAANCAHVRGPQIFRISSESGIHILPSLIADVRRFRRLSPGTSGAASARTPAQFGINGLDNVVGGSVILEGSSSILLGPHGSLKTPMAFMFCREGLRHDGKAIYISLQNSLSTLRCFADRFGVEEDVKDGEWCSVEAADEFRMAHITPKHRLVFHYANAAFMPPEGFMAMILRLLSRMGVRPGKEGQQVRIVIDAISDLNVNFPRLTGESGFLSILLKALGAYGVTSLFLFDEAPWESGTDKVIVSLVDNVFRLHAESVDGRRKVLLRTTNVQDRLSGTEQVFLISPEEKGSDDGNVSLADNESRNESCGQVIRAKCVTGEYAIGEHDRPLPVSVRLYVNRSSPGHAEFNKAVCKACAVLDGLLDQELAHERHGALKIIRKRLRSRADEAAVMAVDLAYLTEEVLQDFVPLADICNELEFINVSKRREETRSPLACCRAKGDGPEKLRVVPSYVDCSLVLCNLQVLRAIGKPGPAIDRLGETLEKSLSRPGGCPSLPVIRPEELQTLREEFANATTTDGRTYNFFGFDSGPNVEALVCLFDEWRLSWNLRWTPKDSELQRDDASKKLAGHLVELGEVLLTTTAARRDGTLWSAEERSPTNSLFYHTWHSLAVAKRTPRHCVPVRLGSNWETTRGGWCWGVLQSRNGGAKGAEVVKYATGEAMNAFLIDRTLGIPPRRSLCIDTGDLSIYNLGLMRRLIEERSSDRAENENYPRVSEVVYPHLCEYIAFLRSLEELNRADLERWTVPFAAAVRERLQGSLSSGRKAGSL